MLQVGVAGRTVHGVEARAGAGVAAEGDLQCRLKGVGRRRSAAAAAAKPEAAKATNRICKVARVPHGRRYAGCGRLEWNTKTSLTELLRWISSGALAAWHWHCRGRQQRDSLAAAVQDSDIWWHATFSTDDL